MGSTPGNGGDGGVTEGFAEFILNADVHPGSMEVLAFGVKRWKSERIVGACLGNEDLILREMAGVRVVLGML